MRRVPRLRWLVVAQALPVVMTDHGRAGGALGPVAAGAVVAGRERAAVRLRAGQDVVPVRRVAAAVDHLAFFIERALLGELVVGAVQIVDVLRDRLALGVLPGAASDPVAGVDGTVALRAQIGAPGLAAGACHLRQLLAVPIGAIEAAEIGALAGAGAGDEEAHVGLLRVDSGAQAERQRCDRGSSDRQAHLRGHGSCSRHWLISDRKRGLRADANMNTRGAEFFHFTDNCMALHAPGTRPRPSSTAAAFAKVAGRARTEKQDFATDR